jgi:predicted TIM-barrel enzyme
VLHVGPSPGVAPLSFTDCAVRRAVAEARLLADAGVSGFLVENTHDAPGVPERMMGPEIAAYLTRIASAVRREVPRLPLGVIVRPRAGRVAMAVALAVDGAFVAVGGWDRPEDEERAGVLLRYRRRIGADHLPLWAEVRVRAGEDEEQWAARARVATSHRADALIVTGSDAGVSPPAEAVEACREATGLPTLVAGGLSPETLGTFATADGYVVGSGLKEHGDWRAPVCEHRARALVGAVEFARGQEAVTLR